MHLTRASRSLRSCLLIISLALAGCSLSHRSTPTPEVSPTLRPQPTLTPTQSTPLVVLILPSDMSKSDANTYQTDIYNLAQASGMRFQVLNSMTLDDLKIEGPSLKIVVAFPPDPGLAALVAAAPQVQFLAIGIPKLPSAPNLSTIGSTGQPTDQQAFLAGYMAAMLSEDYRIGMITLKDDPQGMAAETAFMNGMHFYCGLCLAAFPPLYTYPVHVEIPQDVPRSNYASYGGPLHDYLASVAYVYPAVATPELYSALAQEGLNLIGQTLPNKGLQANWVASIQPEMMTAVQNIFPQLAAGQGGQTIASPLKLTDVNSSLLSDAKLRLAQQILDGLQAGTIDTGVSP